MPPSATREQRAEHGHLNALRRSPSFQYFLRELERRQRSAQKNVCAEDPVGSRDYHAGRLAGLMESAAFVEKRYKELAPIVEVVEQ